MTRIKKYELIINDTYLNGLYKEKERVFSHTLPVIELNLMSGELLYKHNNPLLDKIDLLITERIVYLKNNL